MSVTTVGSNEHGVIGGYLASVASKRLPRAWKRQIYITSLSSMLQQTDHLDQALVRKVARLLNIQEKSLRSNFPVKIRGAIWKDLLCNNIPIGTNWVPMCTVVAIGNLRNSDYIAIGNKIYSVTPEWLKYASKEFMLRDTCLLIRQLIEHRQQSGVVSEPMCDKHQDH